MKSNKKKPKISVPDEAIPLIGELFPKFTLKDVDSGHWGKYHYFILWGIGFLFVKTKERDNKEIKDLLKLTWNILKTLSAEKLISIEACRFSKPFCEIKCVLRIYTCLQGIIKHYSCVFF